MITQLSSFTKELSSLLLDPTDYPGKYRPVLDRISLGLAMNQSLNHPHSELFALSSELKQLRDRHTERLCLSAEEESLLTRLQNDTKFRQVAPQPGMMHQDYIPPQQGDSYVYIDNSGGGNSGCCDRGSDCNCFTCCNMPVVEGGPRGVAVSNEFSCGTDCGGCSCGCVDCKGCDGDGAECCVPVIIVVAIVIAVLATLPLPLTLAAFAAASGRDMFHQKGNKILQTLGFCFSLLAAAGTNFAAHHYWGRNENHSMVEKFFIYYVGLGSAPSAAFIASNLLLSKCFWGEESRYVNTKSRAAIVVGTLAPLALIGGAAGAGLFAYNRHGPVGLSKHLTPLQEADVVYAAAGVAGITALTFFSKVLHMSSGIVRLNRLLRGVEERGEATQSLVLGRRQ